MENNQSIKYNHIKGWGVDADPRNEPTYPMKRYTGDDHRRLNWERPLQQLEAVEVLHSNERPAISAVFGTTLPPAGLSGAIRRYAFKYSESSFNHWLPLLLADRINVVEGLFDDLKRGYIPNVLAEKGWKSAWKYDRKGVVKKLAMRAAAVSFIVAAWWIMNHKKKRL
ncbi:hypothetical protein SAMN05421747_10980 [Parapedobacter composti]|uniref:Uncharacterized protein n=1 Tax=Parapedobacter composti TaxID=623281 RepID=A0A1I1IQ36_9SPHI|nr:hypothetical protein [Parapedobacter composti]SFC35863.1 hypothetical protein SAMN05421747_10980 [Parapedobacter composti]